MRFDAFASTRYSVLHGWHGLPDDIESDIDIAVEPEDLPTLERSLLEADGARLVQLLRHETTCYYFVLAVPKDKTVRFVPVDAATDYRRDGRIWFGAGELLNGRRYWNGFWVAGPEVEFSYLLVKKILKRSLPSNSAERLRQLAGDLGSVADESARRIAGDTWGARVMEWIRQGDWAAFEEHLDILKRVLRRQALRRNPFDQFRYWVPELGRVWQRWRLPTGLWVAVLGPDGAGKTTIIRRLEQELLGAFRRTALFHLMPGVIRRTRVDRPVTDPHGASPRSALTSLVKLGYYWLEYALGYLLKTRPALARSTLVLFDRYFDDLLVDPRRYRYGGPRWAVRAIRRFIPRPDLFLILEAPPEVLLRRKQEVSSDELLRQVAEYRRLAFETPGAVLLDAAQPEEQAASQARDVVLDYLHQRYVRRRHTWFPQDDHADLSAATKALGVEVGAGEPTHAPLRLRDGRGYLLPVEPWAFRRALDLYPARSVRGRSAKAALRAAHRVGIRPLRRVRLDDTGADSVFTQIRKILGTDEICFAVSLGTPGPHRKPVIQVTAPAGEVVGYVKVGWNEPTARLVRNETQVLEHLEGLDLPFLVPQVLGTRGEGDRVVCVQSPPTGDTRPAHSRLTADYVGAVSALGREATRRPLTATSFWQRIRMRADQAERSHWSRVLARGLQAAEEAWMGEPVPLHRAHGDFAPWNALQVGSRLFFFDWEYSEPEMPAGYDLFHFLVQTTTLLEHKATAAAVSAAVMQRITQPDVASYWEAVGMDSTQIPKLFHLYLLDRLSFALVTEPAAFDRLSLLALAVQQFDR